jgi:hypothetical protein
VNNFCNCELVRISQEDIPDYSQLDVFINILIASRLPIHRRVHLPSRPFSLILLTLPGFQMHSHVADPPEWSGSESILYFSTYYYYGINNYRLEV